MGHHLDHVHQRIAENVNRDSSVDTEDLTARDVHEILNARTLGWTDGVVAAVQQDAREYGILD